MLENEIFYFLNIAFVLNHKTSKATDFSKSCRLEVMRIVSDCVKLHLHLLFLKFFAVIDINISDKCDSFTLFQVFTVDHFTSSM